MHRARSIVTTISNQQSQKFASWLLSKGPLPAICATSTRTYNVPASAEPFLNGSSATYVEDMYNAWLKDPASVHSVSVILFAIFNLFV